MKKKIFGPFRFSKKFWVFAPWLCGLLALTASSGGYFALADSSTNLVPNPSLETPNPANKNQPLDWTTDRWGTNKATFTYLTSGHTGSVSVKVQITKSGTGDAKWYFTPKLIIPETKYIFSDYYKSNIKSRVVIMYEMNDASLQYIELAQAPVSSSNWTFYSQSLTTPKNSKTMTVFHLISKVGWLATDDYSLTGVEPSPSPSPSSSPTPSPSPSPTPSPSPSPNPSPSPTPSPSPSPSPSPTPVPSENIIPNASLEEISPSNSSLPASWNKEKWGTNTTTFTFQKNQGHNGSKSVKVQTTYYKSGDAKWFFNVLPVVPGDTYNFSDWYQSNILSHVVVDFTNADGTDYYLELKTAPAATTWTQYSEAFQVPSGAKTMTIFHLINSVGWLMTDDFSLTKIMPKGFNRPLVTLTFDDGWEDNTLTALPMLTDRGFKGTFFFATTYLENSPATGPVNVSGPSAVKALFDAGHEIGSHSVTHPDLTTISASQLTDELTHSKEYLESLVGGGNVKNFASPYGAYNDAVTSAIKNLYQSHRPTDEGFNTQENFDPYRLKVQNMQPTTTLAQYQGWIDQAKKDKSWLVLVYHRIASSNLGDWDTLQSDFQKQLDILKNSGITVETMNQALNELMPQISH